MIKRLRAAYKLLRRCDVTTMTSQINVSHSDWLDKENREEWERMVHVRLALELANNLIDEGYVSISRCRHSTDGQSLTFRATITAAKQKEKNE